MSKVALLIALATACACVSNAEATHVLPQGRVNNLHYVISDKARIDEASGREVATLTKEAVAMLIPSRIVNREGWAQDIMNALNAEHFHASSENVCSVLAVIQRESGFDPEPKTRNMRRVIERAMEAKFGVTTALGLKATLASRQDKIRRISYWQRIEKAESEFDADQALHDFFTQFGVGDIYGKFDFFTTVGSMQVSVRFAQDHPMLQGNEEWQIREFLYTRYGGIYFGSLRLLGYPAGYNKTIYRFADYNVGMYASRNAAIQHQVARLSGRHLALDGDLLRYGKSGAAEKESGESERAILDIAGQYAPNLTRYSIRNDLLFEKTFAFESTTTYLLIKHAYQSRFGSAPYARLPEVDIKSPKITSKLTTASFARAVNKKYVNCLERASQL